MAKLSKFWGLSLPRNIRKHKDNFIQKTLNSLGDKANLLLKADIAKPLQAITSDITELAFKNGKAYLCVHKDKMGEAVYGYALDDNMEETLVLKSFHSALKFVSRLLPRPKVLKRLLKKMIWHQDRGGQYTGYNYVEAVMAYGKISFSKPGTPTDNPGQESFFGRFKTELQSEISELISLAEVKKFVKAKIKYYNYRRLHSSIGYKPPMVYTKTALKPLIKNGRSGTA